MFSASSLVGREDVDDNEIIDDVKPPSFFFRLFEPDRELLTLIVLSGNSCRCDYLHGRLGCEVTFHDDIDEVTISMSDVHGLMPDVHYMII